MSNYKQPDSALINMQSDDLLEQIYCILALLLQHNLANIPFAMDHVWLA